MTITGLEVYFIVATIYLNKATRLDLTAQMSIELDTFIHGVYRIASPFFIIHTIYRTMLLNYY